MEAAGPADLSWEDRPGEPPRWAWACCLCGGFLFLDELMRESGTRGTGEGQLLMPGPFPPGESSAAGAHVPRMQQEQVHQKDTWPSLDTRVS